MGCEVTVITHQDGGFPQAAAGVRCDVFCEQTVANSFGTELLCVHYTAIANLIFNSGCLT